MDDRTKRFYQGAATGSKVIAAHADVDFPDEQTRVKMFFFYAGVLAVSEHECRTSEDFDAFVLGLATRAPSGDTHEDES
jgi:hypothetical protein